MSDEVLIAYDFPSDTYSVDTAEYEQERLWASALWVRERTGIPIDYHETGPRQERRIRAYADRAARA